MKRFEKRKLFADVKENGRWKKRYIINGELTTVFEPTGYIKDEHALPGATGEFSLDYIDDVKIDNDKIRKMSKKINANDLIAEYYEKYFKEQDLESQRANNVESCFKMFDIDVYKKQKIKDVKRTNLCHDKFCINCQSQLSQNRYRKFFPVFCELLKDFSIYHIVFTVPNCSDVMLKFTLEKMTKKFAKLIEYFTGKKKIKGIDFSEFGFMGAVKNLEIVIHENGFLSEFHPHFHCIFILDKKFREVGSHINVFSHSKSEIKNDHHVKNGVRFFCDFEILMQKIWYLLFNNTKVTKKAIDELELGYSVSAQRVVSNFKEAFKYPMKGLFDTKTSRFLYSYNTFKTLYEAIHRKKLIQGYGILNQKSFLSDDELEEDINVYNKFVTGLRLNENPEFTHSSLNEVVKDIESNKFTYISKKSVLRLKNKQFEV